MSAKLLLLAILLSLAARCHAALTPRAARDLREGLKRLYALDYEPARAEFRSLIEREPDKPFGYLFEGGAIWWQASQEYGLFSQRPDLQALFERDIEEALRKAAPMLKSAEPSTRLDGLFVEGMARGTRGQWDLLQGRYLNAYFDGRRAIKYLRLVSRLDPDYHDADLGLGVFEYQIAHFSGLLASIGGLLGLRGSEPEGLRLLRSAMEHGRYAKEQAAQFLATIYIVDRGDWASALPIVLRLRRDFPDSPYAELLELEARWKLGDRTASLKLGRSLFARAQADPEGFRRKLLSLACGLTGESCLDAGQAASMRAWLEAAIASVDKPERPPQGQDLDYLVFLRLLRGQANDALGASGAAASDYDWVRQQPDVLGSRARAQACLRGGCPASEQIDYLRSLARPPSR